ncbi:Delta-9 acyl-phospholipid desaturase [Thalassoporum mexicanum PCC 7367]|uniref:acyl-CoA desaturase n=1 Tax=Thalassoporum mexicanum TaxID=3457544 RepID=UPI00029FE7FC|nr:fatty acid desaturase [Pseudanabaena sp. PCC 7367]AFY70480.1 Delta-9 acyl-phospholipid desaturase [Pseudanabaena sp. PCC 7367]
MTSTSSQEPFKMRWQDLHWVSVAFFSIVHIAAAIGAPFLFTWKALGVMIILHWMLGSLGICLGYHRMLSHRSFDVPKWLERVFVTLGAMAIEGGPIFWAGTHRMHHGFTEDTERDPYSAKRGLWWSHMGWILRAREDHFGLESNRRFTQDLINDPYYLFLDQNFLLLQIPLAAILFLIGQTQGQGLEFMFYGVVVRAVFLWHSTWLINSACHKWGYRNFADADDHATNLWWAAILTYGEGWHNNHHMYPKSAKAGLNWWEIDLTWQAIRFLNFLGLAKNIHIDKPWQSKPAKS